MGYIDMPGYCQYCNQMRMGRRYTAPHVAHLLITLLTMGVWLFVWALHIVVTWMYPTRCAVCGTNLVSRIHGSPHKPIESVRVTNEPMHVEGAVVNQIPQLAPTPQPIHLEAPREPKPPRQPTAVEAYLKENPTKIIRFGIWTAGAVLFVWVVAKIAPPVLIEITDFFKVMF